MELVIEDELPIKGTLVEWDSPTLGHIRAFSLPNNIQEAFIDHKHPKYLGGTDELDNLVFACCQCNGRKSAIPYDDYIQGL